MSSSAELRSFLLSMCKSSEGEWNVALSSSLSLWTFLPFPKQFCGRVAHVSRFLPEMCPQISEHWSYGREVQKVAKHLGMDLSFPNILRGVMYLLRTARGASVPRTVCPSVKLTLISVAFRPETHSPSASNSSIQQQILFHQVSSASCYADCQRLCA